MASTEDAHISQQCGALLKEAVFNTVSDMVNIRRGAAKQIPSISLEEEEGANLIRDMVDQVPQVPDKPITDSHEVQFREVYRKASAPKVGGKVTQEVRVS